MILFSQKIYFQSSNRTIIQNEDEHLWLIGTFRNCLLLFGLNGNKQTETYMFSTL